MISSRATMSGQDRAEENFRAFEAWISGKADADIVEVVTQGRLNRGEIRRECNFGGSALIQNPRIKETLYHLEERPRAAGVLPELVLTSQALPLRAKGQLQKGIDGEWLRKVEAENAGLKAELVELRR